MMSVSERTVTDELERTEENYARYQEWLNDELEVEDRVDTLRRISLTTRGIGICKLLLGARGDGVSSFTEAAEYYLSFDEAITQHHDEVTPSRLAHRPTTFVEMSHIAIIADDENILEDVIQRVVEFNNDGYLQEWGDWEFQHTLFYVKALAHFIDGDSSTARSYLQRLDDIAYEFEKYEALHDCLRAMVETDRAGTVDGLARLLKCHLDECGQNPSTATEFISVEATALLVLAYRLDLDISLNDLDEDFRAFLPEALYED